MLLSCLLTVYVLFCLCLLANKVMVMIMMMLIFYISSAAARAIVAGMPGYCADIRGFIERITYRVISGPTDGCVAT